MRERLGEERELERERGREAERQRCRETEKGDRETEKFVASPKN